MTDADLRVKIREHHLSLVALHSDLARELPGLTQQRAEEPAERLAPALTERRSPIPDQEERAERRQRRLSRSATVPRTPSRYAPRGDGEHRNG